MIRQARPAVSHALSVSPGSAENFDGHLVTSESGWPTNVAPCLRTSTTISRPSRNGSGTVPDVADRHARAAPLRSCDPERVRRALVRSSCPWPTLPVSW